MILFGLGSEGSFLQDPPKQGFLAQSSDQTLGYFKRPDIKQPCKTRCFESILSCTIVENSRLPGGVQETNGHGRGRFNLAYLRRQECRRLRKNFPQWQSAAVEVFPVHPEVEPQGLHPEAEPQAIS
eukprot:5971831-Amphidinium_carterae.2